MSLAVLAAALTAAFSAAAHTHGLCRRLDEAALSEPDAAQIRLIWEKEERVVRLSARGSLADRVTDALNELEAAGNDGEARRLALFRLREALKALDKSGGFSLAGVL